MSGRLERGLSRRVVLIASIAVGLLVVFDLALFGWLIFRSLSQREIEKVLIETQHEAEGIAERIAGRALEAGEDLFTAVASQRETLTYIDSVLSQRDFVYTVEIRDKEGVLVFQARAEATLNEGPGPLAPPVQRELGPNIEQRTTESHETRQVSAPIGDLGFLHIGISQDVLEERIGLLRRDLVRQAAVIAGVTLVMLATAYTGLWWLWRRGRRLEEQAAEAERLAYIGSLAAGLAHEIRNPLNSLQLNMQMLGEEVDGERGDARRLLSITRDEIRRLERLVTDFLSYARPRALELEEVSARELLAGVRDVMAPQARLAGAQVSVEDSTGGVGVWVDAAQMRQLLLNLLRNALEASEGTGRQARIRLAASRQDGRVILEVADNGPGIPAAERERVFDLFYSGRRGGTGLGLAIARRIARAHGGDIDVAGAPGEGTAMRVRLPAERRGPGPTFRGKKRATARAG